MKYSDISLSVLLLDSLTGFEYKHKIKMLSLLPKGGSLFDTDGLAVGYLSECVGEAKANTVRAALRDKDYLKSVISSLDKYGTECITLFDEDYPALLKETDLPPLVLYCNGNKDLLKSEKAFAIVGSRKCLPNVLTLATEFSKVLSESGAVIVTGSAGGADEAAAKGALASGRVISVLAGGIRHVYPAYNKTFIGKIAKVGLVISEQPPDCIPKPWMFPVRNRIIAGLSKGVLIVGGSATSGARHTADYAAEYGRDVFCFPYSIGVKSGELCNGLIKSGAGLCDDVRDLTDFLGLKESAESETLSLDGDEYDVYSAIRDGFDDIDKMIERTNKKIFELAPILTSLEIEGYIVKLAGNKYKAVK